MRISRGRWVSWGALGLAAALAGAAVLGRVNSGSGGLLVLRDRLDHPAFLGRPVLALFFGGVLFSRWWLPVRIVLTRRWHLVYVNGDRQGGPEVARDGPDRIRLVEEKETVLIGLGPDGSPERTVDDGC
ncbi:hypothetical protein [Kitasatospora sp. NPDC057541]|uniref:hypothetical protein n=1 Tax=unclassified Kitasatospora TaxID=2633591 RepID=UPI0036789060